MERRSFFKSLILLSGVGSLGFKNLSADELSELYRGKKLIVTTSDKLKIMCEKRKVCLPRFKSNKSIMDEMRCFVDMSKAHTNELGYEVYGCVDENSNYSVVSFCDTDSSFGWRTFVPTMSLVLGY